VSDKESPASVVEVRHLWSVIIRKEADGPWLQIGTEISDAAAVLRTYDYGVEHHPEIEHDIRKVTVIVEKENIETLREKIEQVSAGNESPDVQSG
jgi:hypothetical protein